MISDLMITHYGRIMIHHTPASFLLLGLLKNKIEKRKRSSSGQVSMSKSGLKSIQDTENELKNIIKSSSVAELKPTLKK